MSTTNQTTINSYNEHILQYINGTPAKVKGVVKDWIDNSLSGLPKNSSILEFGSAFGRDAAYLSSLGYKVKCTDATPAFVDLLKSNGFNAQVLDAISDDIPKNIDYVLANAVLLHFNRDEARIVINKVFNALKDDGRFAFTLKQGEGEEWSEKKLGAPRYFCYWSETQIRKLLEEIGFRSINITGNQKTANATWLQIIAIK